MSTVDEAIEAGARALSAHWHDMHTGGSLDRQRDLAGHSIRAAWPVLSAGLRELDTGNNRELYGTDFEAGMVKALWLVKCELDRIDQELGIGADHQSGDLCSKQYPEVGHEDDGYSCSTHNMPWGECVPESPPCSDHRPVQHRDARPPWCNTCGLTESGEVPTGPLDRRRRS